jgi:F-type H+-transporting ATPase subunit c
MKVKTMAILAILFLIAMPVMAQDANAQGNSILSKSAANILGLALSTGLCGLAQGRAVAGATEAMGRNPGAIAGIRGALILGLVLIESLALYTLVIVFIG